MVFDSDLVIRVVIIGLGATAVLDLWNLFLKRVFQIPSLNYCLLGRWLRHMPEGTFRHASITAAAPRAFECQIGWVAHYSIGAVFALIFVGVTSHEWPMHPTLWPALLFGVVTVVFPYFLMQPAFGLGIAASKTPRPAVARLKSLATHAAFGVGLWVTAVGVNFLLRRG
jgi:DUF2938 family protein